MKVFGIATATRRLYLDDAVHKATLELDEEGTEAAGATAVILEESARPRFDGNRPFIYLIRDNKSGAILFMGRVMDPTKS